ncbi:endo-alpha-N-acetylgalactosaminidase family protein [Nonomuraea sp. NPDC002799]
MRRSPVLLAALALTAAAMATPVSADPVPAPTPTYELPSPEPSPTGAPPPSPTAQDIAPEPAEVARPITISSPSLTVELDPAFPRVLRYTDRAGGASLGGSTAVPAVVLNGQPYAASVALSGADGARARYRLTFGALPGVVLAASVGVRGRVTTFRIDSVADTEAFRVGTIDLPGHDLVSVSSAQPGAATAFTRLDPNATRTADVFAPVTAGTAPEAAPAGAAYAIVNTDRLAAAVESNSTYDRPSGVTDRDAARLWHQARRDAGGTVTVAVWSGQWTHRAAGSPFTEEPPWAKVVVTPDANGDGSLDWQDGAIAFRSIGVKALGAERTKDRVVTHIPFNFSSQATHPFLRTLDDVKRVSLATDGLGQLALLKGYQSEGHDSAHPDYGGNHNRRAGGLTDLNTLLRAGKGWNATFGVHVNATEAYPEARAFSEQLIGGGRGWNWLDQAYLIDQRGDLTRGTLAGRLARLRRETDGNLGVLYVDVFRPYGWVADRTLAELRAQGWQVTTEWSDKLERSSLWAHWANDLNYGGVTNKGLNSQIIRFIRNDEKDVWNAHPILGNARIVEFEGWTAENDFTAFLRNVWEHNLPVKFLQQQKIMDWDADEIVFGGGVRGTYRDGRRELFAGGRKVLDGSAYLLPWQGRHYHYNAAGGVTIWEAGRAMTVYELTDQGRVLVGTVTPRDGKITLRAEAGVPYVLHPGKAPAQGDPRWGQGAGVRDPGFNDDRLGGWRVTGPVSAVRDGLGRRMARLAGGAPARLEQRLTGLAPGRTYTASAYVEVEPGHTRRTTLEAGGASVTLDRSTARNYIASDDKHDTFFQRVRVTFAAPPGGAVTLRVTAAGADGDVRVDDVRLFGREPEGEVETFESVEPGWGPFVKGDAGGSFDARTHLSERHEPYTRAGWDGKTVDDVLSGDWSLKVHEERQGLVYRTLPWTARFEPGHAYEVSFRYQNALADTYQWVTGYDQAAATVETRRTPIPERRATAVFSERVVAGCGDVWVGLRSLRAEQPGADFILDDFAVTDLGVTSEAQACGSLDVVPASPAFEQGAANEVATTFTNLEDVAARDVLVELAAPDGWTVAGDGTAAAVEPGQKLVTTWRVTPPADAAYGVYELRAVAGYTAGGARRLTAAASVRTLPAPPVADVYASDLEWVSAGNGWGPVERDRSNGDTGPADGGPIVVGGRTFAKGLGTHAPATVRFHLGGRCTAFTAVVGVDDSQAARGSVRFSVVADGVEKAGSPVLRAADAAYELSADVSGARYADLVAGDGGDGNGNDHADWGAARFTCG